MSTLVGAYRNGCGVFGAFKTELGGRGLKEWDLGVYCGVAINEINFKLKISKLFESESHETSK